MTLSAIDAFAGAGGLSLGLVQAGWDVRFAFDNDALAVATYARNIHEHVSEVDARAVTGDNLLELADLNGTQLGLLAGGPPCQGFSMQGRGDVTDDRNALVTRFVDFVEEMKPRAFLLENVPALLSVRGRPYVEDLISRSEDLGYSVHIATLDAADYGVPQFRKRAFIVGIESPTRAFGWPEPTTAITRVTVRDAIGSLPSPPRDGSRHPSDPNHYRESKLSKLNRERIKHVPPGGGREYLPRELQLACHQNGHRHLDTYGRLAWDEPSVTLTARFDSFTRGRFGHPEEHRSITLREGARLQGFPDSFVFEGSRAAGARMIGNAVPLALAAAVARALRHSVELSPEAVAG